MSKKSTFSLIAAVTVSTLALVSALSARTTLANGDSAKDAVNEVKKDTRETKTKAKKNARKGKKKFQEALGTRSTTDDVKDAANNTADDVSDAVENTKDKL